VKLKAVLCLAALCGSVASGGWAAEPAIDESGKVDPRLRTVECKAFSLKSFTQFLHIDCDIAEPIHVFSLTWDLQNYPTVVQFALEAQRSGRPISVTYLINPKENLSGCYPDSCRRLWAIELRKP
jgi:hypothetical protein